MTLLDEIAETWQLTAQPIVDAEGNLYLRVE